MVILDPYGMTFDAVGVFGLVSQLLFKSCSSYCGVLLIQKQTFHQKGTAHKYKKSEKICMWFKTRCVRINDFTVHSSY